MAAQPQERVRKRLVWFSPVLLAVALTPAFLQTQYTCERPGNTRLSSLEFEVQGVNRLVFDPTLRAYEVWLPAGATTVTLRAQAADPTVYTTWYVQDAGGVGVSGALGVGGGEVTLDLPPDGNLLGVGVYPSGGAIGKYTVNVNPLCPEGDPCTNGGVPGTCFAGVCEIECPVLTSVLVTPLQADVGDEINVSAQASGAGPINYLWTATGGSFVDPSLPITAYRCEEAGQHDLTITISDGTGSCMDGTTVAVTCLGGGDIDPPVLTDFDFNPKSVDVSTQSQDVTCTMTLTDSPAGVDNVNCQVRSPSGQSHGCGSNAPTAGDVLSGIWDCTFTIPQNAEEAVWDVYYIFSRDNAGNSLQQFTPELQQLGFPTQLDVTSAVPDADPPVLTDFDFNPKSVDVSTQSQDVTCTMTLTDSPAGVDNVNCQVRSPSGQSHGCGSNAPTAGDVLSGIWDCTFTIPQNAEEAVWDVYYIFSRDNAGNSLQQFTPELQQLGFPTQLDVTSAGGGSPPP